MNTLASFRNLLKEQMTPTLAYGLAGLLVLALLYVWSGFHAQRLAAEERLADAQRELAGVSDVGGAELWQQRADAARDIRSKWDSRAWGGETPGIVSAQAQARLSRLLIAAGLQSVQVSVSSDPTSVDDGLLLRFDASAVGDSRSLINIIVEISALDKAVNLTEIVAPIRAQGRTRIVLGGFLPYQPPQSSEGDPS